MVQKELRIQKTAHYFASGELTKETKYIWMAMHGYGQTAERLLEKFDFLNKEEHLIIAPEGLNNFYWHSNNAPVACWMTKRNRYHQISEFVAFLDSIYNLYCRHVNHDVQINLFGFSQGCATIWRWLHASQPRFHHLINWCGWIPEDISYLHMEDYFADKEIAVHYGNQDKYMTPEILFNLKKLTEENNLSIPFTEFDGEHRVPRDVLRKVIEGLL